MQLQAQTGAGTATVTRALTDEINKKAVPGDRVSERSLVDKVRNFEGKRKIDNVNNKTEPSLQDQTIYGLNKKPKRKEVIPGGRRSINYHIRRFIEICN